MRICERMRHGLLVFNVIDCMSATSWWTTLDALSAYSSMPLTEEDREETAFSVSQGKYQLRVTTS